MVAGMMFSASRPDGKNVTFRVIEANDQLVLVDTNHPLAGETLHISIHVHDVRNATTDVAIVGLGVSSEHALDLIAATCAASKPPGAVPCCFRMLAIIPKGCETRKRC